MDVQKPVYSVIVLSFPQVNLSMPIITVKTKHQNFGTGKVSIMLCGVTNPSLIPNKSSMKS